MCGVRYFVGLESRNYLRMKVMVPLKVVTDTEERPSPTSPTYFLPSPSALKPLFQNGPIAIFLADDAATRRKAESPGIRTVMSRLVELNSYVPTRENVPSKKIFPIVFCAITCEAVTLESSMSPSDET